MKTRVELDAQVVDFVRALAPDPRRRLRVALHNLEQERGDLVAVEGELTGYSRLRVGRYRIVLRFYMDGKQRVARCVFAEQRSTVYALFADLLTGQGPAD